MNVDQYIDLLKELGFHNKGQLLGVMEQNKGALMLRGRNLPVTIYFNRSRPGILYFFADRRDDLFPKPLWDRILKKKELKSGKLAVLPKLGREREALEQLAEMLGSA